MAMLVNDIYLLDKLGRGGARGSHPQYVKGNPQLDTLSQYTEIRQVAKARLDYPGFVKYDADQKQADSWSDATPAN